MCDIAGHGKRNLHSLWGRLEDNNNNDDEIVWELGLLGILGIIWCSITTIIFMCEHYGVFQERTNSTQSSTNPEPPQELILHCSKQSSKTNCQARIGGVELDFIRGTPTAFQFDLYDVIDFQENPKAWRGYDVYLCVNYGGGGEGVIQRMCQEGHDQGDASCPSWGQVAKFNSPYWIPYGPYGEKKWWENVLFYHASLNEGLAKKVNPFMLTLQQLWQGPGKKDRFFFFFTGSLGLTPWGRIPLAYWK